jgi:hypothetical protein
MNPADPTTDTAPRAELFFREDAHDDFGVREVVDRLDRLDAAGVVGTATVAGAWPRFHTPSDARHGPTTRVYDAFTTWAEANGLSLEPGFQRRTRGFLGTEGLEDVVVFPVVALTVGDTRRLCAVFPCTDGSRTYTVDDALSAFERGDADWFARFESVRTEHVGPDPGWDGVMAD